MSARQSAAVDEALRLIAGGTSAYAAAKMTGIAMSTVYRAIKRQKALVEAQANPPPARAPA